MKGDLNGYLIIFSGEEKMFVLFVSDLSDSMVVSGFLGMVMILLIY